MSFQVIIDYDNIFLNNKGLGSGMSGTIYNYYGYIIKLQSCNKLMYYNSYHESIAPYKLKEDDKKNIDKYKKLASVVNNLPHFIKIKGYLICPNLNGKKAFDNCTYRSIIYENAGKLTKTRLPFNKESALQLLEILKSFKQFNLAGWFHQDIQGCNNIEPNEYSQLYVIDYEDLKYVENSRVNLILIKIDINKMMTCIFSYTFGKTIAVDFDLEFEINLMIIQEYLKRKPISYDNCDLDNKQVANVRIQNCFIYSGNYNPEKEILDLISSINYCIELLESIQIVNINICEFIFLLENYILNYSEIMDFISKIKNKILRINDDKSSIDYKNCIKIFDIIENNIRKIIEVFYSQHMYFNFYDITYIIESVYNFYIKQYYNLL
jgi:hypothetical protein